MNYFEVKCKFVTVGENGKQKKVSESYLVQDEVFAGAEQFMQSELQTHGGTDHEIKGISIKKFSDVITGEGGKFYKCKLRLSTVDENTGKKKIVTETVLHEADCIERANALVSEYILQILYDVEIVSITETNIVQCFLTK